jgi:hypothetical protein
LARSLLQGVGKLVASNAPGPRDLAEGFRQTVLPVLPAWALIAFLLLFGEPIVNWMTH